MTNWLPNLAGGTGPLYQRLAQRIEADIDEGILTAGSKLPPQRDLAYDIQTTVGTVGRAYSLLRERGLVSGEVGRGTYILDRKADASAGIRTDVARTGTRFVEPPPDKLRFDTTAAPDVGQGEIVAGVISAIIAENPMDVASYTRVFPDHWFEAGSQWLRRGNYKPSPTSIVPTLGVHAAAMAIIAALTSAGDQIVFEHLTYAQIARAASLLGRRIALVRSDRQGMDPEDLEAVCAQKHPKMIFLTPSAHNPTCSTLPLERRRAIAEIARRHNVLLIEDDLYGHLADDDLPLISEIAPERTFVAGGLSKSVAAGLRGGWIAAPEQYRHRLRIAHKMLSGGASYLLAESAAQLVLSGQAEAIHRRSVEEINGRLALVDTALEGRRYDVCPNVPFVWLSLPDPWNSGTFKQAALDNGVLVDDEDEFKPGRSEQVFNRVRFGVTAGRRSDFALGLETLRRLLDEGPLAYERYN